GISAKFRSLNRARIRSRFSNSRIKFSVITPPPASVKAVEEICVTCGGAHPYYQCLAAGGNTFLELRDNIQGYVAAVGVNYNQEEDERVEDTLTDQDLAEYTIKVPPPLLHINITFADDLILILKYHKMLKALLSNKEKLLELANTPLMKIAQRLSSRSYLRLGDPGKFLIPCGFSELKCKALADLGTSINLMPLSVWKKLGLPELISTRMTFELANRAICTPVGIVRDVFVPVGKFTFPADFVIVGYESDPRVPLFLGRPFLRTARALIDDSIDQSNPVDLNDNLVDTMPEMFTDEHALDYSSPPLYDEYDDDLFEVESDTEYVYDDPFDSNGEKIKEYKLLIDELDLPSDFLPSPEYDSFLSEDFSKVDALPSTNNEDKVFNPGILIQENLSEIITRIALDKKLAIFHAYSILEDFDPPLYELPLFKEVHGAEPLLSFSSENEEKVFKPRIHTSKEVHSFLTPELSHQGYKLFKINQILKTPMEIFLFSRGENIRILDVPCLHFYPP
nr:reverse transcriptase domain-containing protein [Tanacetum cinerariifolium]